MTIRWGTTALALPVVVLLGACSTSLEESDRAMLTSASQNAEAARAEAARANQTSQQALASSQAAQQAAERAAADARAANEKADRMFQRSLRKTTPGS
jgi:hypothetical protein